MHHFFGLTHLTRPSGGIFSFIGGCLLLRRKGLIPSHQPALGADDPADDEQTGSNCCYQAFTLIENWPTWVNE